MTSPGFRKSRAAVGHLFLILFFTGCVCLPIGFSLIHYPTNAVYQAGADYLDFLENEESVAREVLHLMTSGVDRYLLDSPYQILSPNGKEQSKKPMLKYFVRLAHQYDIEVVANYGVCNWWKIGLPDSDYYDSWLSNWVSENIIIAFDKYQSQADPEEQFDAVLFDVEFWLKVDKNGNDCREGASQEVIDEGYLGLLEWARMKLGTVPLHGYLTYDLDNASNYPLSAPDQRSVGEAAIEALDQAHIAVASDAANEIVARSASELEWGAKYKTPVYITVETVKKNNLKTTFYDESLRYMSQQLTEAGAAIRANDRVCSALAGFSAFDLDRIEDLDNTKPILDTDGDGIENEIDDVYTNSSEGFSDGKTSGSIIDRGGLNVTVQDADDSALGVLISVSAPMCGKTGSAVVSVPCLAGFDKNFPAGKTAYVTCP